LSDAARRSRRGLAAARHAALAIAGLFAILLVLARGAGA